MVRGLARRAIGNVRTGSDRGCAIADDTKPKMKNGLVKRGSTWSYYIRVKDPATGKMKSVGKGGFATWTEARDAQTKAKAAEQDGTAVAPSQLTLGAYLTDWLEGVELHVKATTARSYRMHVEVHIVPALGGVKLQAVSPAMLRKFYAGLLKDGRCKRAKDDDEEATTAATDAGDAKSKTEKPPTRKELEPGLSPATVRRIHATLHKALADAVDDELLARNPASKGKPPKVDKDGQREMQSWTEDELRDFLKAIRDDWSYPLFYLAATTGMRRGELCGLRWKDVDLTDKHVRVQNARIVVGTKTKDAAPKRNKRRTVNIDAAAVAALKAHRKGQAAEALKLAGAPKNLGYVFTQQDGQPLHPDYVTRLFNTAVRKSGVRRIRLHDLRHTHASLLLAKGIPVRVVSERLGHETPAFTMAVYQHVLPGQQQDAADAFGAMLASSGKAENDAEEAESETV